MDVWPSRRSDVRATNVCFKSARLRASGVGGQAIREFYLFFTLDPFKGPSLANLTEMSTVHDQE